MSVNGQTAKQMLNASEGAFYVWFSDNTSYPQKLATFLNRSDLKIITLTEMYNRPWRGTTKQVVVDHRAEMHMNFRPRLRDEILEHHQLLFLNIYT